MMPKVTIFAPEFPVLVDQRFAICIANLQPFQRCTLRAELRSEKDEIFESYAQFIANISGEVCLDKDPSFGGSYSGIDAMGLFWSMLPAPGQRKGLRYTARNIEKPMKFDLQLFDGHIAAQHGTENSKLLASKTVLRTYLSPLVERTEISVGRIRGTLFIPKGEGKFPGVIDMFGSHGDLLEYRAALLASHGFVVFALAFFCYKDLPTVLNDLELEYFLQAVDWFSKHERVYPNGIGYVGVSYGGQIALQVAAESSAVKAVVAISSPVHVLTQVKFNNKLIGLDLNTEYVRDDVEINDGCLSARNIYDRLQEELSKHEIEVEKIAGHIMALTGENDRCMKSAEFAAQMKERVLQRTGRNVVHLSYPGTGHLIEPPYMSLCSFSFHKIIDGLCDWGGEIIKHGAAQQHAWLSLISFLKSHLTDVPKSKL